MKQEATDDALKEFFAAHQAEFDGTELHVAHILLRPTAAGGHAGVAAASSRPSRCGPIFWPAKSRSKKRPKSTRPGGTRSKGATWVYTFRGTA